MYSGASTIGDVAGALPYMAVRPGGLAGRRAATGFGIGGLQGTAASPDWSDFGQTGRDALTGGALGGAIGGAVPLASAIAGRAITPFEISPKQQAMADALKAADVPLTAGQAVGSPVLQGLEREGIGAAGSATNQNSAFTKAVMDKGGIPASDATQSSIA
jgi:hypothetical protein